LPNGPYSPGVISATVTPSILADSSHPNFRGAWLDVISQYTPAILGVVWRAADSPEEREDLVQEVWGRAHRGIPNYAARNTTLATFVGWLQKIAVGVASEAHRKKDDLMLGGTPDESVNVEDLEDGRLGEEHGRWEAFQEYFDPSNPVLNASQREYLRHHLAGYSHAEIADALGITHAAARQRWVVIVARLKQHPPRWAV
jgi:RNA polymerase sigma factor (sigma-70 family)